jgi:hypothetical protein
MKDDVEKKPVYGLLRGSEIPDLKMVDIYSQEKQLKFLELIKILHHEPEEHLKQQTVVIMTSAIDALDELKLSFDYLHEIYLQQLQQLSLYKQMALHQAEIDKQQPTEIKNIIRDIMPFAEKAIKTKEAKANGKRKGVAQREAANQFLSERLTKVTHINTINYFADLLLTDNKENPERYDGISISRTSAHKYSKFALESVGRLKNLKNSPF